MTAPSDHVWACRAAKRPSGMPIPAANSSAATVSSMVAGKRTRNSFNTGWLFTTLEPKSPLEQAAEVPQVLLPEGVVEAQVRAHRGDALGRRVLAEDRRRGVAGKQVDEGEQDDGQAEQDGDRPEKPADDVLGHRVWGS